MTLLSDSTAWNAVLAEIMSLHRDRNTYDFTSRTTLPSMVELRRHSSVSVYKNLETLCWKRPHVPGKLQPLPV
nr:hypothetical protein CFP56_30807 [Quercus suber]